jgi:prepilin-type N-terminal cleavage/methylation domain-containing protein
MNQYHGDRGGLRPRFGMALLAHLAAKSLQPNRALSGFTLVESLVAIIIIAVTVVSIIPSVFWATATRVQNRRVEQAVQLAQGEVDRVRTGIERKDFSLNNMPPQGGANLGVAAVPPPTQVGEQYFRSLRPECNRNTGELPPSPAIAIPVDTDPVESATSTKPCKAEFYVQVFRGQGQGIPGRAPDGFLMGVRVYSIAAAPDGVTFNAGLDTKPGRLRGTSGVGTQQSSPLAVQYTPIVRSNLSDGIKIYRDLCAQVARESTDGAAACFDPNSAPSRR